jgi:hypothetical protein
MLTIAFAGTTLAGDIHIPAPEPPPSATTNASLSETSDSSGTQVSTIAITVTDVALNVLQDLLVLF